MEITAQEMKKSIQKIYDRLDKVTPVEFDCGKLCGEICCVAGSDEHGYDELALYLLPGEELMYEDSDEFELYYMDSSEIKYPHSWKDQIYLVKCINPPKCDRSIRPIQCRTFPLVPHLTKNGEFHLVLDETEFPYTCPIVRDHIKLNRDFVQVTYEVWMMLISNPLVYDLVDMDSRMRDSRKADYDIVI
jgi:Fe-S-cluster containining protein